MTLPPFAALAAAECPAELLPSWRQPHAQLSTPDVPARPRVCDRTWTAADPRDEVYRQHRCGQTGPHDECVCRYWHDQPVIRPAGRWGR